MTAAEGAVLASDPGILRFAWLIVLLPLLSSFLIVFFGKRMPGRGAEFGILAAAAGFLLSVLTLWHFVGGGGPFEKGLEWARIGPLTVEIGEYVDGLTAVMFVVVTFVSLCIQIYSIGYMRGDRRYTWYFAALSLFTGSMLNLVLANNLFQLLIGWELVGICSYLLIGHWWEEKANSSAAIKAFITTKTGDVPFLFGIFTLVFATGTSNIQVISRMAEDGRISSILLTAGALLLFGGAIGKSAQFPLHVWLPDAMAGPTPVSALIHAATMVAAGVYLVGRMYPVFLDAIPGVLQFVGIIGGITMLIAALLAMVQDDIKRVLAYSTISQLAYMMAGLSLGEAGYTTGLFHLFTQAFFKALLFLGAGSVIHAARTNDMSEMGGLRKVMPVTFWTFLIGAASMAGIPPLAGFWSKDEIISTAFRTGSYGLWAVSLVTAMVTAFYTTRMVLLTFFGDYRGAGHPHESPRVMTVPLVILAVPAALAGFLNAPFVGIFGDWVFFGRPEREPFSLGFAALSVVGALVGLAAGYQVYARWRESDPLRSLGPAYTLLERKYFLDDLYLRGIVRPIQYRASSAVDWFDRRVLDGIVHGVVLAIRGLAAGVHIVDERVVDGAVNGVAHTSVLFGRILRRLQSGNVQRYALLMFAGLIVLAVFIARI